MTNNRDFSKFTNDMVPLKDVQSKMHRPDTETATKTEVSSLKIGDSIQRLRHDRGISLSKLAQLAQVSKSNLSKIENNAISPTFDTIERVASGLGVPSAALLSAGSSPGQMLSFTDAGEGLQSSSGPYALEHLFTDLSDRRMVPMVTTIPPTQTQEPAMPSHHGGEEFFFVLEGEVEFESNDGLLRRMMKGDSAYFSSDTPHLLRNHTQQDARVLWVWLG